MHTSAPVAAEAREPAIAFATNLPILWEISRAGSAWVALDEHHALRANAAWYASQSIARRVEDGLTLAEDPPTTGGFGVLDLGVGWTYFPTAMLAGTSMEAGVMCRFRRVTEGIVRDIEHAARRTDTCGVRALIGWTWRLNDFLFLSGAFGASIGYEHGRAWSDDDVMADGTISWRDVAHVDLGPEGYLRLGVSFGDVK